MSEWRMRKKDEQALRLLEALSGVDGELLERSAGVGARKAQSGGAADTGAAIHGPGAKAYRFVMRHGKACAACLCLFLLGAAFWGIVRPVILPKGMGMGGGNGAASGDTAQMAGGGDYGSDGAFAEEGLEMERAEETPEYGEVAEGAAGDGGAAEEPQWFAGGGTTASVTENQEGGSAGMEVSGQEDVELKNAERENSTAVQDSPEGAYSVKDSEAATGGQQGQTPGGSPEPVASRGMEDYIPSVVPTGYQQTYERCEPVAGGGNSLTLMFSDGERHFWLHITETEYTADMSFETKPPVLTVKEDWKSLLPAAEQDGSIQFGLLFEDGVLVEYQGYLTEEEICEMFASLTVNP